MDDVLIFQGILRMAPPKPPGWSPIAESAPPLVAPLPVDVYGLGSGRSRAGGGDDESEGSRRQLRVPVGERRGGSSGRRRPDKSNSEAVVQPDFGQTILFTNEPQVNKIMMFMHCSSFCWLKLGTRLFVPRSRCFCGLQIVAAEARRVYNPPEDDSSNVVVFINDYRPLPAPMFDNAY